MFVFSPPSAHNLHGIGVPLKGTTCQHGVESSDADRCNGRPSRPETERERVHGKTHWVGRYRGVALPVHDIRFTIVLGTPVLGRVSVVFSVASIRILWIRCQLLCGRNVFMEPVATIVRGG